LAVRHFVYQGKPFAAGGLVDLGSAAVMPVDFWYGQASMHGPNSDVWSLADEKSTTTPVCDILFTALSQSIAENTRRNYLYILKVFSIMLIVHEV
jgi:hypothetical protein